MRSTHASSTQGLRALVESRHMGRDGYVRGPGSSTSDSIQARLSDGEFVLPADTVKKVGVKSLRDLVASTHTPTGKSQADHYADGGLVDDPSAVTRAGNSYSGTDIRGNITINGRAPGGTYSENPGMRPPPAAAPAPAPAAPGTQPAASTGATPAAPAAATPAPAAPMDWAARNAQRNLEVTASSIVPSRDRDAAQVRLNAMNQPAAVPTPGAPQQPGVPGLPQYQQRAATGTQSRPLYGTQPRPGFADGGLVKADDQGSRLRSLAERIAQIPVDGYSRAPVADGSQDSAWNTDAGRNVANTLNALPGTGSMLKSGRMVGAAAQSLGAAREVGATNAAIAAGRAFAGPGIGAVSLSSAGSTERPAVHSANAAPAATNRAADLGHYNEGELMGPPREAMPSRAMAAGPTPTPAQPAGNGAGNEAYSRLLALATGSAAPAPGVTVPMMRHSGNDWQARNDLRNASVSASSIMNTRHWGGRGAENNPAMQEYRAMLATDQALRQAEPALQIAGMRERGSLQREGVQQHGSSQRAALGALGTADSNEIARGRLSLEQIAAGYQSRSSARLEAAQQAVENAQTPAEQRSARQRLLTLLGKDGEDRWKSVALQGGTDAQGNKTESILGAVNERTGEMRRMPTQVQPAAAPPDGSMVRGKDGRLYEVKNGQPVLVGG